MANIDEVRDVVVIRSSGNSWNTEVADLISQNFSLSPAQSAAL